MTENSNRGLQLERIVFFSDAVFAIAITLLIIEVKVPHLDHAATDREFVMALVKLLPNFVGYFFSFLVIGAYWIGHHKIYGHIVDWDYGLVWRNVFFLLAIAFMPFSTAFFSEYVSRMVPIILYATSFTMAGVLEVILWRYAMRKGLTDPATSREELNHLTWRMSVLPAAGVLSAIIGFFAPIFSGIAFAFIPVAHRLIGAKFRREELSRKEIESGTEE